MKILIPVLDQDPVFQLPLYLRRNHYNTELIFLQYLACKASLLSEVYPDLILNKSIKNVSFEGIEVFAFLDKYIIN